MWEKHLIPFTYFVSPAFKSNLDDYVIIFVMFFMLKFKTNQQFISQEVE